MILEGWAFAADAPVEEAPDASEDPALTPYRAPFESLVDRAIGTTSSPVAFDWRRSPVMVAGGGSFLLELNNFNSARAGALVRIPTGGLLFEVGVSSVHVWDTPSSRLLALTPYRQPGRPDRIDLDVMAGIPLAEGIVTATPKFFPAVELVFDGYAGLRYSVYPTGFAHLSAGDVTRDILDPALSEDETNNLEDARLDAMQVDPARYGLVVGFGNDLYFQQGVFLSPRVLFSLPLLAPASGSELLFWADLSFAVGVAL